jgi:hypothetical protein
VGKVAGSRLIPVRVGRVEIAVEAVPVAGTEPTPGRVSNAAGSMVDAFGRAQETIAGVARSTAEMIERAGAATRSDRTYTQIPAARATGIQAFDPCNGNCKGSAPATAGFLLENFP